MVGLEFGFVQRMILGYDTFTLFDISQWLLDNSMSTLISSPLCTQPIEELCCESGSDND